LTCYIFSDSMIYDKNNKIQSEVIVLIQESWSKTESGKERTTITIEGLLLERCKTHLSKNRIGDSFSNLIERSLINQLEKEGDFEVRDLIEEKRGS